MGTATGLLFTPPLPKIFDTDGGTLVILWRSIVVQLQGDTLMALWRNCDLELKRYFGSNADRDWRKFPGPGFNRDRDFNRDQNFY